MRTNCTKFLGFEAVGRRGGHSRIPQESVTPYRLRYHYGYQTNEFGFVTARQYGVQHREDKFQRELNFAIIDEVDFRFLIRRSADPVIISGPFELTARSCI